MRKSYRRRSEAVRRLLEAGLAEPELWEAAIAWRDLLAGPPRLAEEVFSWVRVKMSSEALVRRRASLWV